MMKTLATLFLVTSLTMISLGQSVSDSRNPPDLVIEYFQWDTLYIPSSEDEIIDAGSNTAPSQRHTARPAVGNDVFSKPRQMRRAGYLASLLINNTGARRIKAIEWEFSFINRTSHQVNKQFRFRSKQKISAGTTVMLHGRAGFMAGEFDKYEGEQKVSINRIEYADGTVWQRQ